jgi:tRNA pseudouridine38-40 synthase
MPYRLTIQYDGTDFAGWQTQARGVRTVQGELESALALIDGGAVTVHGAGRTDAGVHAEGQVASVALRREWEPDKLRAAINGNTGRDVRVIEARIAPADFHARFSARGKTYRYGIFNEQFISPLLVRYAHHEPRALNVTRMRECARVLIGEHDWTAFSSAQAETESRVRNLTRLEVAERWDAAGHGRVIEITASAEGFLRYMMRAIAGTLIAAGRGELSEDEIARALATADRALVGATAPARGLTLVEVHYESDER